MEDHPTRGHFAEQRPQQHPPQQSQPQQPQYSPSPSTSQLPSPGHLHLRVHLHQQHQQQQLPHHSHPLSHSHSQLQPQPQPQTHSATGPAATSHPLSLSLSHSALPSISLPSIAHIDAGHSTSQQHFFPLHLPPPSLSYTTPFAEQLPFPPPQLPQAQGHLPTPSTVMGSQLPPAPPMTMGGGYYPPGQHPLPHLGGLSDPNAPVRYPLPAAPDPRMSGARPKKEIKRRTKTGCLTCRKRRIKCDEGHPTCHNCMKSKRECAGYDPIFKAQPGPTNIQPAPHASALAQPLSSPAPVYPSASHIHPEARLSYPAAMPPGTSGSPAGQDAKFDYGAAIDPALESASAVGLGGGMFDGTPDSLAVKPCSIDDLLNVGSGLPPPTAPQLSAIPADKRKEIESVFVNIYAPGMDKFFEVRWFTTRAIHHLLNDQRLCEKFIALTARFGITASSNYHENLLTQSLETHVIWECLILSRQVSASIMSTNDPSNKIEVDAGVHVAAKRLQLFESVITNQQVAADFPDKVDEFDSQKQNTGLNAQLLNRERLFWKILAVFASIKADDVEAVKPDPNVDPAFHESSESDKVEATLKEMRNLLDSRENRDILYSIAAARHVGQTLANKAANEGMKHDILKPTSNSEDDPATKLNIARSFIQSESNGKGTTQAAQRICGMAMRSWNSR